VTAKINGIRGRLLKEVDWSLAIVKAVARNLSLGVFSLLLRNVARGGHWVVFYGNKLALLGRRPGVYSVK